MCALHEVYWTTLLTEQTRHDWDTIAMHHTVRSVKVTLSESSRAWCPLDHIRAYEANQEFRGFEEEHVSSGFESVQFGIFQTTYTFRRHLHSIAPSPVRGDAYSIRGVD